jgi:ferrochelatase
VTGAAPGPHGAAEAAGVLVMAHGTPAAPGELEAFYTRIRRGSPPSAEQLADLRRRYDAIGGISPLAQRTAAQVDGLAAALEQAAPGRFVVRFGAKHTAPTIEEAARALAAAGVGRVVGLVLTPHRASMGSDEYLARAARTLAETPGAPELVAVPQWYDAPGFAELVAGRVRAALDRLVAPFGAGRTVLFTAHSVPRRVVEAGDPYPAQVAASAEAAATAAALGRDGVRWEVAWQSAGRTPEPWIGPDLLDVLARLGADRPGSGVVVCPIGFVADHLEVLYDVDLEARDVAAASGLVFSRTDSLNDDPALCAILAEVVAAAADRRGALRG